MRLTSPRFNFDRQLQMTADNAPPMSKGAKGEYVRHVQQALIDLGHPMPKSTAVHGTVDGMFGTETKNAVIAFQRKQKLTDPGFHVDGIVGAQTMSAFDRLLRTPITLPPLATPGGVTDPHANLVQSIISVLSDALLSSVNFEAAGVIISHGDYLLVRKSLEDGAMTAEVHRFPPGVRGVYFAQDALDRATGAVLIAANTFALPFGRAASNDQKATVVHEATHAICDMRAVGRAGTPFTRDQSESIAHIAQAVYHRRLAGAAQSDPLGGFLTPIFTKADEVAQEVIARTPLTRTLLAELIALVSANRIATGGSNRTDFNGL